MEKTMAAGPDTQADEQQTLRDELIVSTLLRSGVLISLLLVAIGAILMFATGSTGYSEGLDLQKLLAVDGTLATAWPRTIGGVITGALAGQPYALILLGLLLLIATPVLRVATSAVLFLTERDYLYVAITLFVLGVLVFSFLLGSGK